MNQPRDELLERYADAVAQDPRRPSERVRNAACAHAQLLHDQTAAMLPAKNGAAARPAANQPQWTLSLVASLAVVGLAGLMYLQIDRSTQQDREIAMGAAAPSPTNPATAVATHQEKSANPVVPPPKVATQTGASKATEQFADASARVDAKREVRAEFGAHGPIESVHRVDTCHTPCDGGTACIFSACASTFASTCASTCDGKGCSPHRNTAFGCRAYREHNSPAGTAGTRRTY